MQRQTAEIQSQASQYQQQVRIKYFNGFQFVCCGLMIMLLELQYEDILVKFKRQKKQLEELSQPSSDQLNTEVCLVLSVPPRFSIACGNRGFCVV